MVRRPRAPGPAEKVLPRMNFVANKDAAGEPVIGEPATGTMVSAAASAEPIPPPGDGARASRRLKLRPLASLIPYLTRYRGRVIGALVSLAVAAVTTLIVPIAVRRMIDFGFSVRGVALIDSYFLVMIGVRRHSRAGERSAILHGHDARASVWLPTCAATCSRTSPRCRARFSTRPRPASYCRA